ncbi:c-type cytochrome [Deinococcus pimensis]|uniref:c-type cytochrome n=1 Tax=Deinococcus pimensis TaxID=309888 RepID=UPI000488FA4F|nr:cytochrome c [Deinococcus pimensis]
MEQRSGRAYVTALAVCVAGAALGQGGGAKVFAANCSGCHGVKGEGLPYAYPPLAGHVPELLGVKGGRTYVAHVLQHGLVGELRVKGVMYGGGMPSFEKLSDADFAAVLNYVATSWGNRLPAGAKPFTAAEVKKLRAGDLTARQVFESRPAGLK